MATGRDIISASLRLIGANAPGDAPTAAEASDGLSALNALIDSLSTESLLIFAETTETLVLTAGTKNYTMGTAGSIPTRAMKINSAMTRDTSGIDYPMNLVSRDEYDQVRSKTTQSNYPTYLYDDGGYPLRTLSLWPVPSAAYTLVLAVERPLTQITTLDTALSLPQGYDRMLRYNLAIDLAPEYGRPVSQEIAMIAVSSKDSVKRANYKSNHLRLSGIPGDAAKPFNIFTGGNN